MKTITALFSLLFGIISASEPIADRPYSIPKSRSEMNMKSTEILLKSGITDGDLAKKLNSIPLVRIGLGYVLYFLADGTLTIPLYENKNDKVDEWEFVPNHKPAEVDKREDAEQAAPRNR